MVKLEEYASSTERAWCPGCGNFPILEAIKRALVDVGLAPHEVIIFSGIGQASKLPDYLHVNAFTSLHGRPIAIAQGAHLANHRMKVIAVAGDGDTYGLGGNHFMHLLRRNAEITLMVHDNLIYGADQPKRDGDQDVAAAHRGNRPSGQPPSVGACGRRDVCGPFMVRRPEPSEGYDGGGYPAQGCGAPGHNAALRYLQPAVLVRLLPASGVQAVRGGIRSRRP
jgi:hypothetical protein